MADAIARLRGLVERAKRTGDYATLDKALDRSLPALIEVAEAAKKLVEHTCDFDLETALANLETHT